MGYFVNQSILIVAGESSGDNVGGLLCAEIKILRPELELFGLGGDRMDTGGVNLLYHTNQLSILGFWEILKHLPFIREVERKLLEEIDRSKPSLAILIDYPGFNLRLARKLKERKIPVMYYVSPQVWAWGKGRIAKIKRIVDKMVVVFQFEREMYEKEGLKAEWYGHPLLEIVYARHTKEEFLKRNGLGDTRYIGLFPGSRIQEIERILPVMRDTISGLTNRGVTYKGIVGCAPGIDDGLYKKLGGDSLLYLRDQTYDLMAYSELNLVASGTATLECAILGRPLFVLYETSPITYHIAKSMIKIPFVGLVNVVAGEKIVPEFIQGDCRANLIASQMMEFFADESYRNRMIKKLSQVKAKLGNQGASKKVAQAALGMLENPAN
jgi:lipid-A-disaccharide synthase